MRSNFPAIANGTMNIKQLEYFVAVAEELHFGRAAERLGIAQPPLSRQIKQIEDSLGARLLNRGRSSVTLTQAGERLYERTKDILNQLEDTRLEIRRIGQGAEGRLRIGFVGSATYGMFPNILKSFRINFPDPTKAQNKDGRWKLRRTAAQRGSKELFACNRLLASLAENYNLRNAVKLPCYRKRHDEYQTT